MECVYENDGINCPPIKFDRLKKMILIVAGIVFIVLGLLMSFGIIVYSLKEQDGEGFNYLFISAGIIILGLCFIVGSKKNNSKTVNTE